jgi:hypothetical protein
MLEQIPGIARDRFGSVFLRLKLPNRPGQMFCERNVDFHHVSIRGEGVGVEQMMEVLNVFQRVGYDDGTALKEVSKIPGK